MSSPTERIQARSELMQLLAFGLSHPTPERFQRIADGSYQSVLAEVTATLFGVPCSLSEVGQPFVEFEAKYIELFSTGNRGQAAVGLTAGDYSQLLDGQPRPELMAEYARWYKHFGLRVRQSDQSNEQPDHLICQLEFLAWLSKLEVESHGNTTLQTGYQRAQRDFIQRHLQPLLALLVPSLTREVERRQAEVFVAELGEIISDVVDRTFHEFNSMLGPSLQTIDPVQVSTPSSTDIVDLWS